MKWETPAPDWDTLAGGVIDRFLAGLSEAMPDYDSPLTVSLETEVLAPARRSLAEAIGEAEIETLLEGLEPTRD